MFQLLAEIAIGVVSKVPGTLKSIKQWLGNKIALS